jgi:hypothetical protein
VIGLPELAGQADENSREKVQNVVTDSSVFFHIAKDLHGRHGNHVPNGRIRLDSPSFSSTAARGPILRRLGCQKSTDQHIGSIF